MKVKLKSPQDLRLLIIQKGFNQTTFADHIGLSFEYISRILNEQLYPSGKTAKKITDGLGVTFEDLFFVENGHNCNQ